MTQLPRAPLMPPEAPLKMPVQDLGKPFHDPSSRTLQPPPKWLRAGVFALAAGLSLGIAAAFYTWFGPDLSWGLRALVVALVLSTVFWIALSPLLALVGLCARPWDPGNRGVKGMDVAILVPVFGERPEAIEAMLATHLGQLSTHRSTHRFTLYVLSDTQDPAAVLRQRATVSALRARFFDQRIHYRHRAENTDFKTGNLRDWVTRWGGLHEAMIVLDADSYVPAQTLAALADALSTQPQVGLIQTIPRLHKAHTVFGRMQQFSNEVAGRALGHGLGVVSGAEANFWGHNAILRTQAYAACAGLPHMSQGLLGGVILSHDFVEAALLRRAGWEVRLLTTAQDSFEEGPQTAMAHILRDRRWCRGNLQHLRLIGTPGFAGMSRFHMVQGVMAYLASVLWCGLLVIWSVMGLSPEMQASYFSAHAPLFPTWPTADLISKLGVMGVVFGLLLAPRLIGVVYHLRRDPYLFGFGGPLRFAGSLVIETALSVLTAPMMMVQHMRAVIASLTGRNLGWRPHQSDTPGLGALARFHWVETALGGVLVTLCALGWVSVWCLPIAVSLCLTVPVSWAVGLRAPAWLMRTAQDGDHWQAQGRARPVPAPIP
ncbi:MAG: glucans biosynthesis glucosyltransferase MdoH [Pseudomonadota bacterium]